MPALPVTALVNLHLTSPVAFAGLAVAGVAVALLAGWLLVRRSSAHPRPARVAATSTPESAPATTSDSAGPPSKPVCLASIPGPVDLPPIASPPGRRVPKPIAQPRLVVDRHSPASTLPEEQPGRRRRPVHRGSAAPGLGYAELSRSYAALGRTEAAALAQWAADLRLVHPLMGGHGHAHALPDRLLHLGEGSPRETVIRARDEVLTLVAESESEWLAPPMFPSATHVPDLSGSATCTTLAPVTTPHELRARAAQLMERAGARSSTDAQLARHDARRADLAAFDAVLLDSADRYGDVALVSVELRQQFAAAELHHRDLMPDELSLDEEIQRTRGVLRTVLEPHELDRFEEALAEAPPLAAHA